MQRTSGQLVIDGQATDGAIVVACDCGATARRVAFGVNRAARGRDWTISGPDGEAIVQTVSCERAVELARLLARFRCHGRRWQSPYS